MRSLSSSNLKRRVFVTLVDHIVNDRSLGCDLKVQILGCDGLGDVIQVGRLSGNFDSFPLTVRCEEGITSG